MNVNGTDLARRALITLPIAMRITTGVARVSVASLRALVLVTALLPLSVLLLTTLAVREAATRARRSGRRALRPPGSG
jgi:hypothetical protein